MTDSHHSIEECVDSEEECVAAVKAVLRQEQSYHVPDYLRQCPSSSELGLPLDANARSTIVRWCLRVIKICQYKHDIAAIAIDYLDRYVATHQGQEALLDRRHYQLASLTCVYCAIKLHGDRPPLGPTVIAKLSNGEISHNDVENMELKLLHALEWRMNPPTAMSFVRSHLDLVHEDEVDVFTREAILDLSQLQVNESLLRYDFVSEKRSRLGLAALLNAADSLCDDGSISTGLEDIIHQCTSITPEDLAALRFQLYECISSTKVSLSSLPILRKPSDQDSWFSKTSEVTFADSPRAVMAVAVWDRCTVKL
jgi:hypothetical protein